ncbi:flagellar biosynthesis protein FlhA [Rhodospirillum rubrum]|uniref:Flagellar biosynthesis protein FlhA n=1 Tax=Rhodospirillum rubrum (strain ATCC 11170 / ATH 1.1.1 / DSM 467 / LMG 4362 / NCIMB 8255 / S1) TaxID=269796 RepID=Q2RX02_RHORT|nr:Flagellar biosynthesis protein FlhA [Rhodospirillum rubrum ATCC 11170]AEO47023.1 flagellar biosynthesis protein FlhA [Rhodospirillum rubrum F11]MBK5952929.1 flagellar biosynthesis protein FlhA [Rhodospirillum rubrum]QXG81024.1 flagellar biosynthesis protein FlhA [Rhodospirillum rubrum]HAQ00192.1 flagellar biosynthesis protein FlhA [Rhodospirillum rubrum]
MAEDLNQGRLTPLPVNGPGTPDGPPPFAFGAWARRMRELVVTGEFALPFGLIAILVVLILPMPTWLLDIMLAMSLTLSVLILMTVVFIRKALEFSTFPMVLLITTMLRLALNLASTRLILAQGHEGTAAAGHVIEAFGGFIMGGNFVIGVIVFSILVLVNFMVITKGATRIAEVTARFTLDAMPGKQMAIDADLSSGLIDETEARRRREEMQKESDFFGAMDGASKFVRGDAIAGIIITFINVIGGMIIGIAQNDLTFSEAANTYTALTVGDGLVSQIPALIISVAAGVMVSKGGLTTTAETALIGQFTAYPKALGMSAFLAGALALVPGTPALPFLLLAGLTGGAAWWLNRKASNIKRDEAEHAQELATQEIPVAEEPISTALKIDLVRLELGYGLLSLINTAHNQRLTDQIKALRRALATDMGFVMPPVRIQDNMQLAANTYRIYIKEVEAGHGDLRPTMLLVMDPRGDEITLAGEKTHEPTFGLPAVWVDLSNREEAMFRGYTVVDPPTVITTHITEVVKDHMAELLSYAETQKLLDDLDKEQQKLIADMIPTQISTSGVQRVLQNLLAERVSIRDLPTILEGVAEACGATRNIMMITEHVRTRIARQLSDANVNEDGIVPLVTLSPQWETAFAEALIGQGEDRQLSMAPSKLQEFIVGVRQTFERFAMQGESPVLLTSPMIRPYVRSIIERFRPMTVVMSQNEIHPKAKIKTLGQI